MNKKQGVLKHSPQVNHQRCVLCHQSEDFPIEDPLLSMSIHTVCLELLAANLPSNAGKALLGALTKK
jgi:hypothetical protein